MALELTEVKRLLQDHLQEGLLLIVGTGLSMAEGIPGMWPLGMHLKNVIPPCLDTAPDMAWNDMVAALDAGDHLEAAMGKVNLKATTVDVIVEATARFILEKELEVFARVISGAKILPFTTFVKHLFKAGKKFHLITPNYDRLIEFATEAAGIGVDTRFVGHLIGHSDPKRSADSHRELFMAGKNAMFRSVANLCIYKPHGSLDWFDIDGRVVRCPINIGKTPIIITPGSSKYRESFRWAFDDQRTSGNKCVANATRLMFIGYGFNDDHLEQHLCPDLKLTKPTVIITKQLSENAKKAIANSSGVQVIALCSVSDTDSRTRISNSSGEELIVDEELWHLDGFNKGVI
ncbi:MAG: SIR2-like domain-containing protein [Candidatus Nitrotoga sp. SPKER]|nr:MAG: SIR2-like domain-containing protein [Candidatus Nitrotoga sp. SPKER]